MAMARRELLLGCHRHRLRREDLEDAYSQAVLELLVQVKGGRRLAGRRHIANAIEQRFLSRVADRRRALAGRSGVQALLEGAVSLVGGADVGDRRAEVHALTLAREELRLVCEHAPSLRPEQRLVLATQVSLQMPPAEFRRIYGWSGERYRKTAQRGRARLSRLVRGETVPPGRVSSERKSEALP